MAVISFNVLWPRGKRYVATLDTVIGSPYLGQTNELYSGEEELSWKAKFHVRLSGPRDHYSGGWAKGRRNNLSALMMPLRFSFPKWGHTVSYADREYLMNHGDSGLFSTNVLLSWLQYPLHSIQCRSPCMHEPDHLHNKCVRVGSNVSKRFVGLS